MSPKARKALEAVFAEPIRTDVRWAEVEALFRALGAEVTEGRGSRVRVALNGARATFHRPHPEPTLHRAALKSVRKFLEEAGVKP